MPMTFTETEGTKTGRASSRKFNAIQIYLNFVCFFIGSSSGDFKRLDNLGELYVPFFYLARKNGKMSETELSER